MFTVQYLNSLNPKNYPYKKYEKASRAGFGVQVSPKGTKTFLFAYKIEGKQRFMKLGIYNNGKEAKGKISLKTAGEEWYKANLLKQENRDPQVVRDNKNREDIEKKREAERMEAELAKQGTYEQLLDGYIDYLKKERSAKSVQNTIQAFKANAYKIINKETRAKEITFDDINDTLAIIEQRGAAVMTNRMRAYLSGAFSWGIKEDNKRITVSRIKFGLKHNIVQETGKAEKEEEEGTRELSKSEIKYLWFDLDNTNINSKIQVALKLMIATGQRLSEVLRINENDIDETEMLWELEKTKNGRPHVVALPEIALDLIHKLAPNKKGFLLSSDFNNEIMDLNSISKACARYCKQSGFKKFTPRDLRRTWKTQAGFAKISKSDRDRYQNHAINDVSSKHYDRYDYLAEKRNVANVWNSYLSNILLDQDSSKVPTSKKKDDAAMG